jgi:hypothetical protein
MSIPKRKDTKRLYAKQIMFLKTITGYTLRATMQNGTIREQLGLHGVLRHVKAMYSPGR